MSGGSHTAFLVYSGRGIDGYTTFEVGVQNRGCQAHPPTKHTEFGRGGRGGAEYFEGSQWAMGDKVDQNICGKQSWRVFYSISNNEEYYLVQLCRSSLNNVGVQAVTFLTVIAVTKLSCYEIPFVFIIMACVWHVRLNYVCIIYI